MSTETEVQIHHSVYKKAEQVLAERHIQLIDMRLSWLDRRFVLCKRPNGEFVSWEMDMSKDGFPTYAGHYWFDLETAVRDYLER